MIHGDNFASPRDLGFALGGPKEFNLHMERHTPGKACKCEWEKRFTPTPRPGGVFHSKHECVCLRFGRCRKESVGRSRFAAR